MRTKYTLVKWSHFNSGGLGKGGKGRGVVLVSEADDYAPLVQMVVICIYFKQVTHRNETEDYLQAFAKMSSHGPFSSQKQWNPSVLISTAVILLLNNIIFNSMQQIQQWTILSSQIPCNKISNEQCYLHRFYATNSAVTFWIEFSNYCNWMPMWTKCRDLVLIPECDCHQLFILLLWYFKPEASLNYVANWSLFLCFVFYF